MLVTSKQFEAYKQSVKIQNEVYESQIQQLHELIQHISSRIDDVQEDLLPPPVMGG